MDAAVPDSPNTKPAGLLDQLLRLEHGGGTTPEQVGRLLLPAIGGVTPNSLHEAECLINRLADEHGTQRSDIADELMGIAHIWKKRVNEGFEAAMNEFKEKHDKALKEMEQRGRRVAARREVAFEVKKLAPTRGLNENAENESGDVANVRTVPFAKTISRLPPPGGEGMPPPPPPLDNPNDPPPPLPPPPPPMIGSDGEEVDELLHSICDNEAFIPVKPKRMAASWRQPFYLLPKYAMTDGRLQQPPPPRKPPWCYPRT